MGLKSRGFNFENTHLVDAQRITKLLGLLALAFAWTYQTGELLNAKQPILFKKPFSAPLTPSSAMGSISSATASSSKIFYGIESFVLYIAYKPRLKTPTRENRGSFPEGLAFRVKLANK